MGLNIQRTGETVSVVEHLERRDRLPHRGARTNAPFLLAHLPSHWDFDFEAGEFLPGTVEAPLVAGSHGVKGDRNPAPLKYVFESKGGVVIDERDSRLGAFERPVQMKLNTKNQPVYYPLWCRWEVNGNECERVADVAIYREFQRTLVKTGIVRPISNLAKKRMVKHAQFRLDQMVERHGANPANSGAAEAVDTARAELHAMQHECSLADARKALAPNKRRGA